MSLSLKRITVGTWPMNTYIITCESTGSQAIVDPGAEPEKIMAIASENPVSMILITHGHEDHISALEEIRRETGAPVFIHPLDAEAFRIDYDYPFEDDGELMLGEMSLQTIHTPGHTQGSTCIDLKDHRILVGDTVFVGGPGKTWSPEEFQQLMLTMETKVFKWSDEIEFFPGHGPSGWIRDERPQYEAFVARGYSKTLFGDITWEN